MTARPALITGIGAATPLGPDVATSWQNLLAGKIALATGDPGLAPSLREYPVGKACYQEAVDRLGLNPRQMRRLDPTSTLTLAATQQAIDDAGLETPVPNARVATVIGVGFGAVESHRRIADSCTPEKVDKMSPFSIPAAMPNAAACNVSLAYGAVGPTWTTATACAAGLDATGIAYWLLSNGLADVAFAGGVELIAEDVGVGGLSAARALSKARNGDPAVLMPFDVNRKGTAVGEGAAMLVLETPEHAEHRGARVRARVMGYSSGSDAYHITAPRPDGSGAYDVMDRALRTSEMRPEEIQAIFAHGTGTPLNDAMEGKAVARLFNDKMPLVTSTKGQYGHAMGASGPINIVFAVRAIEENRVPATITCHEPDPECRIKPVMGQAAEAELDAVMVNAFGFGGHNASIVLRRA